MAFGESQFWRGVDAASRFFMDRADVHTALRRLVAILDAEKIPYAIAGGMALNAYGYQRVTVDVDVLLRKDGVEKLKAAVLGRGYLEKFPGSKGLRDTENNVPIDVLIAGEFPGDGKPKAVSFPDPALVAEQREGAAFLPLKNLVELKLASGISAPHRLRDLADVIELTRAASLPRNFGASLDASVQTKFDELWLAAQTADAER